MPVDWSYVAGYFDGEGHVGFHQATGRNGTVYRTRSLQWINTHRASLEAIREHIQAGSISTKCPKPNRKPCYLLTVTGKANLLRVLECLIPRLIIKREAAERLRDHLLANVKDLAPGYGKAAALTAEQLHLWYHVEGKSLSAIAALVGVSVQSIHHAFKRHGIPCRKAGGPLGHRYGPRSEETKRKIGEARRRRWASQKAAAEHPA